MSGTVVAPAPAGPAPQGHAHPPGEAIIEFRDITKSFGDHCVYERMSLSVRRGETLTIIGGSGQGKSVCLKMMIGLLRPDSGSVRVDGTEVTDLREAGLTAIRRKVAYVFQGGALFDSMNVLDNVVYALREHKALNDAALEARASECLRLVGLSDNLLLTMPASLSGGMRKRVALARSIAMQPEVILYDEPTTGLDPKNIARIGDMIIKLQRELGVTSVVVTHDMPMAFKVSNRVAMLYERAFPFVDTPDNMWNHAPPEVTDFVYGRIDRTGDTGGSRGVA